MPLASWPDLDLAMWRRLVEPGGPLDDHGALAHLRQTTLVMRMGQYGRWLAWLQANDPTALVEIPESRATMERLRDWLKALAHVSPISRLMFVSGVLHILRKAAPEVDWEPHMELEARLRVEAGRGSGKRKLGRILSSATLLDAGLRHSGPDAERAPTTLAAAKCCRDGTMVALLALMPLRRRAFAGLRLGRSLLIQPGEIVVALDEDLTKTGVSWEAPVPDPVLPALRRYLDEMRPWLMARSGAHHDCLWVCNHGKPYKLNSVGVRIGTVTERLTGVRVPPHFFRNAAATTLARMSPKSARLIRPLLAHSNFKTAERHYNHARTIDAGRDYAALIARLKREKR